MAGRKHFITAIAVLLAIGSGQAQSPVAFRSGKLFGFALNGRTVIHPQFDYAVDFNEGIALVKKDNRWGFIDESGNYLTKNEFTSAEPLRNGKAMVFQGTKCGLIDSTGSFLLLPVYDSIYVEGGQGIAWKNGRFAWCSDHFRQVTEAVYTEVIPWGDFISFQKGPEKWDLFTENGRLIEDMDSPVFGNSYHWNSKIALIRKNGKYGLFRGETGWLFPPHYDTIAEYPFPDYTIGNDIFSYVYLLEEKAEDPALLTDFKAATGDGKLISEDLFKFVGEDCSQSYYPDTNRYLQLIGNDCMLEISKSFRITRLPYTSLKKQGTESYIAVSGSSQFLLDKNLAVIGAFSTAEPLCYAFFQENNNQEAYLECSPAIYDDYVLVSEKDERKALYSLQRQTIVSPFIDSGEFLLAHEPFGTAIGVIYSVKGKNETGFYHPAMKTGTPVSYKQVVFLKDQRFMTFSETSGKASILEIRNGGLVPFLEDDIVFMSEDFNKSDYGSGLLSSLCMAPFDQSFFCTQNSAGKLGFRCFDGTVIPDLYDSIGQNSQFPHFVNVCSNGLYGVVNLENGKTITPYRTTPPGLIYDGYSEIYYIQEEDRYVDEHGAFYALPSENFTIYKKNGKYGMWMQSDFTGDSIFVLPPVYRQMKLLSDWEARTFFDVSNDQKLHGLLNFRGDTILPFDYTVLEQEFFYQTETPVILARKGKKSGLFTYCNGLIVPAVYDNFQLGVSADYEYLAIETSLAKKKGLYSFNGSELLAPVYDNIVVVPFDARDSRYKLLQVSRNDKWFMQPLLAENPEALFCEKTDYIEAPDTTKFKQFDFIIDNIGFVAKNGSYSRYQSSFSDWLVETDIPENQITTTYDELSFFVVNGKIGVKNVAGKVVLKPRFTNVHYYSYQQIQVSDKGENYILDIKTGKKQQLTSFL